MSNIKSFAKDWLPPAILSAIRHRRAGGIRFEGNYGTWEEAAAQCTGYDAEVIFAKVLEATLKVKRGEAAYERDSVVFDEIQYAWPVTAGLMFAAAHSGGVLDVMDFGGAMGSSYFQNRKFIDGLPSVRWSVIEQAHYVKAGNLHIQDEILRFYASIDDCLLEGEPNVVLLSSVLQYLPKPNLLINKLLELGVKYLVIDRTPFLNNNGSAVIKIQHVPSSIYLASYPCWFFKMAEIVELINNAGYSQIEVFDSLDKLSDLATWRGLIFKRDEHK